MTADALVIGYGNALRGDDGAGWRVVDGLLRAGTADGVQVLQTQQLMPELAYDVSRASAVVFVDSSRDVPAGTVAVRPVTPVAGRSAWSHHLTPEALLALSRELYGSSPAATLVTIGAQSFALGEQLSEPVAQAIPVALETVIAIVGAPTHA